MLLKSNGPTGEGRLPSQERCPYGEGPYGPGCTVCETDGTGALPLYLWYRGRGPVPMVHPPKRNRLTDEQKQAISDQLVNNRDIQSLIIEKFFNDAFLGKAARKSGMRMQMLVLNFSKRTRNSFIIFIINLNPLELSVLTQEKLLTLTN